MTKVERAVLSYVFGSVVGIQLVFLGLALWLAMT